ncbi:hypothetical protein E2C01_005759 [Portunus trituberculatus]|uniref:Uncharacterized protein n=1 Tax=Portunus trituberculatus TaxID=210409 RepID=A0A5B7CTI9_PORTR|nr:hypothetical protein [Portunus trituberculatus]
MWQCWTEGVKEPKVFLMWPRASVGLSCSSYRCTKASVSADITPVFSMPKLNFIISLPAMLSTNRHVTLRQQYIVQDTNLP